MNLVVNAIKQEIKKLSKEDQERVKTVHNDLEKIVKNNGQCGYLAIALLGAELSNE